MTYLSILFTSVFITNIMFYKLDGLPSVNKETKLETILVRGISNLVVGLLTTLVVYPLNKFLLVAIDWTYLLPILAVIVALNFTLLVNYLIKKINKFETTNVTNYKFLLLNSTIVSAAIVVASNPSFLGSLFEVIGFLLGHLLLVFIYYTMRPRLDLPGIPKAFKGIPIMLITISLIAMVFLGLAGIL